MDLGLRTGCFGLVRFRAQGFGQCISQRVQVMVQNILLGPKYLLYPLIFILHYHFACSDKKTGGFGGSGIRVLARAKEVGCRSGVQPMCWIQKHPFGVQGLAGAARAFFLHCVLVTKVSQNLVLDTPRSGTHNASSSVQKCLDWRTNLSVLQPGRSGPTHKDHHPVVSLFWLGGPVSIRLMI